MRIKIFGVDPIWHLLAFVWFSLTFTFFYIVNDRLQFLSVIAPAVFSAYYFIERIRPFAEFKKIEKMGDSVVMIGLGFFLVWITSIVGMIDLGVTYSDVSILGNMKILGYGYLFLYPLYYVTFLVFSFVTICVLKLTATRIGKVSFN